MTRQEWAERLPLIQAFVEGKTIQVFSFGKWVDGNWEGKDDLAFESSIESYRIKPELKVIWVMENSEGNYVVQGKRPSCTGYKKYVEVIE